MTERRALGFLIGVGTFLVISTSMAARPIQKIKLVEPLHTRIVSVVNDTEAFHRAYFSRDPAQIKKQTDVLISSINKAVAATNAAREQGLHIRRILEKAKSQLLNIEEASGDSKKLFLQESFRELVILLRNYDLNLNHKIFFCGADKSFWLQAGNKPQNPVNPEGKFAKCGSVMQ